MSVSGSIPATVQIRRGHLLGLIGAVAALAACVTWVVTAFAFDTGTSGAVSSSQSTATSAAAQRAPATFTMTRKQTEGLSTMAPQTGRHADPLMSMTRCAARRSWAGNRVPAAERSEIADRGGHPHLDEPGDTAVHRVGHEPHVRAARRRRRGPALAPRWRGEVLPSSASRMRASSRGIRPQPHDRFEGGGVPCPIGSKGEAYPAPGLMPSRARACERDGEGGRSRRCGPGSGPTHTMIARGYPAPSRGRVSLRRSPTRPGSGLTAMTIPRGSRDAPTRRVGGCLGSPMAKRFSQACQRLVRSQVLDAGRPGGNPASAWARKKR